MRENHVSLLLIVLIVSTSGCQLLGKSGSNGIRGGMQVANEQLSGTASQGAPRRVYVADFKLDASTIKTDSGLGGVPDQVEQTGGLLGRLSQRKLFQSGISGSPEEKAHQIVDLMAEDLVKSLQEKGLAAERIGSISGTLPKDGWLIQGNFTDIDEGNRMERSAIGFGFGSTQMEVKVGVSDLASPQPIQRFITSGTVNHPNKMSSAAYNPHCRHAQFRMQKKATREAHRETGSPYRRQTLKSARTISRWKSGKMPNVLSEDRVNPQDQEYSRSAPYQQGLVEAVSPQHTDQPPPFFDAYH